MDTTPASGDPPRTATATDAPLSTIGRFTVHRKLGEGGMGAVYLATDPTLGRRVAVKVLHREDVDAELARRRLVREAQSTAQLSHENVIVVHEVGTHAGQVYLAMEYVAGTTLKAWQVGKGLREVLAIYLRAGQGLLSAHVAGLVHRDFKPDNVLVADDGRVRVTDFGLVAAVGTAHGDDDDEAPAAPRRALELGGALTETGAVMGTPRFMAPEQHLGQPVDARADQFAFCVALYEAVYHQAPFAGHTYDVLVAHVLAGEVLAPPPGVTAPPALRAVLERGLRRKREERHPSMEELLAALREIQGGLEPAAVGRPSPRRWPWIAGALVAVAAASIAVAVVATRGGSRPSSAGASGAATMRGGEKALTYRGDVARARLSPDGRLVAIVAGGELVVTPVDGGPSRVLARGTQTAGLGELTWSIDSRRLTVLEPEPGRYEVGTGAFTPSGPVAISNAVADWPEVAAWLLPALAPLDEPQAGAALPRDALRDCVLPGGQPWIDDVRAVGTSVFITALFEDKTTALLVTDRACASPQVRIARNDAWRYVPLPDGGVLAIGGNRRHPEITRHDRRGVPQGSPRRLPLGTTDVIGARPDGSLVLMRTTMTWRLFEQGSEQARDLARGSFPARFALAPDGHRVALIEERDDDERNLYLVELAALEDRTHRVMTGATAVAWSPDGARLAVMVASPPRLLVVDPGTGASRDLGVDDLGVADLTWLDARRVAYPRPDSRAYRWIDTVDGTRGDLLDGAPGWTFRGRASPADGSFVVWWNRRGLGSWLLPPGGEPRLIRGSDGFPRHAWTGDGHTLWIADGRQLDRYDPRTDQVTPFRTLELEPTVEIRDVFAPAQDRVLVHAENTMTDLVLYTPDAPL